MKILGLSALLLPLISCGGTSKGPSKVTAWKLKKGFENPESAYYEPVSKILFVSSISGEGTVKDKKGWITTMTPDGVTLKEKWLKGLNAPKGMRARKGVLWVTDIDRVLAVKIKTGKIIREYKVPGAKFLNDIVIDSTGTVYFSDTLASKIFKIKNGKVTVYMKGDHLASPNGLLIKNRILYVAAWGLTADWSTKKDGSLYSINLDTKSITPISKELGNLDGLEFDLDGNFLISDWVAGKVFRVSRDGLSETIHTLAKGSADIGFIPEKNLIIIPEMLQNHVTAIKN